MDEREAARAAARERLAARREEVKASSMLGSVGVGAGAGVGVGEEASTSWVSDGYTYTEGSEYDEDDEELQPVSGTSRGGAGRAVEPGQSAGHTGSRPVQASGRLPPLPSGQQGQGQEQQGQGQQGQEQQGQGQQGQGQQGQGVPLQPIRVGSPTKVGGRAAVPAVPAALPGPVVLDPADMVAAGDGGRAGSSRGYGVSHLSLRHPGARTAAAGVGGGPSAEVVGYYRQTTKGSFTKATDGALVGAEGSSGHGQHDESASAARRRNAILATSLARSIVDWWAKVLAGLFVFSQGVAAGLALTVFVLLYVTVDSGDVAFLRLVSPLARTIQGMFFFFLTCAFLGAIDKYAKDKMGGWYGSWSRQGLDILIIVLYGFALLFTSLASSTADIVYFAHERVPGWYEAPGAVTSSFADDLDTWRAFDLIRIWATLIAWALLSLETTPYNFNDRNDLLHLATTSPAAAASLTPRNSAPASSAAARVGPGTAAIAPASP